jgi:hypothetical protein
MTSLGIKIITWNMGNSINKILDWTSELQKWTIISPDSDILFITIQETTWDIGSVKFLEALKNKLDNQYNIFFEGNGSYLPYTAFYVFGYLCVKKNINIKDNTVGSTCIYKYYVCTKPTIGFGIVIDNRKLLFICSHLPINTYKKEYDDLGYKDRIEAMQRVTDEVINTVSKTINGADVIFWAGDMNFRIETNSENTEQLTKLLTNPPEFLKEFQEDKINFKPSCRLIEYDKENYDTFIKNRIESSGYDKLRNPSYCDRIIYKYNKKNNLTIIPKKYFGWPTTVDNYPLSIAYSDHTPVCFECKLIMKHQTGGGNNDHYKMKYYKYKSKYINLNH